VYPGRTVAPTDAGDATLAINMPRTAVRQASPRVQPRKLRALAGVHQWRCRKAWLVVTSSAARAGAEASMPTMAILLVTVCPPVEHARCVL